MSPSMSARDEILARVRSATSDITTEPRLIARLASSSASERSLEGGQTGNQSQPEPEPGPHPQSQPEPEPGPHPQSQSQPEPELEPHPQPQPQPEPEPATLDLFAENVADYRATVVRVPRSEVGAAVVDALRSAALRTVVVPTGLDAAWQQTLGESFEVVPESDATTETLNATDAVVTGSAIGIATTGTIVLDHRPDQGRRALTLVPDTHVCIIGEDQVVHDVPEAVSRLRTEEGQQRALTWISGPSATSDIELQRVEGVHGPRTLIVIIAAAAASATAAS